VLSVRCVGLTAEVVGCDDVLMSEWVVTFEGFGVFILKGNH
jgi:hypothetical protein